MLRVGKSGYFTICQLLLLICYVKGHAKHGFESKCTHDTDEAFLVDSLIQQTKLSAQIDRELNRELGEIVQRRKLLQSGQHQPIRIHADYQLDGVDQNLKQVIQEMIIPTTQTLLYNTFSVKNGASNQQDQFFLPARCNETTIVRINGVPTGESWCSRIQDMCGPHAQHNQEYFLGYTTCRDRNDCQDTPAGSGLAATDFILYVTAIQSGSCLQETSQVASAGMCNYDEDAVYGLQNRPLAAFVNFCPNRLQELDATSEQDMGYAIDTAVHELMHGLFMGRELYQLYIDDAGQSYNPVVLDSSGVPRFVTSPKVVAAARENYNCDALTNVPLEDEGGEGTAGSHWEKAIFHRELMLGGQTIQERSILSPMTLSLAEDSGWYVSNFSNAGQILQGRDAGCGIFDAQDTCTESPLPTPLQNDFCNTQEPLYQCTNNFQSVGTCPSESIGLIGGCRMLQKVVDLDCGFLVESSPSDVDSADFGSRSGRGSRCLPVQGNEFQRELDPRIFTKLNFGAQCFRVRCLDDKLFFYIPPTQDFPGVELQCPENESVSLSNLDLGFKRSLSIGPCPKASDVCTFWGCPHANGLMCGGQGDCYGGSCQCYLGYKGNDCAQKICTQSSCGDSESCNQQTGDCVSIDEQVSESRITLGDSNQAAVQSTQDRVTMEGVAFDGYLQGCVVKAQGVSGGSEQEQPFTMTDALGRYRFQGSDQLPLMIPYDRNCTDVLVDFPPLMDLFTPFGSNIISPLSTLVHYMKQKYAEVVKEAGANIKDGLGLPLSVDIYHQKDLLKELAQQEDASLPDRIAYSTSIALVVTPYLMSTYLALDLKLDVGNAFMLQVVDTIVEQKVFSPTNELDIKQQLITLLNNDALSTANFSASEEQLIAVSKAIAAYNQAIIQQSRRQGPTGIEFLTEVVGLQRAAYLNATLAIASFRKNEINVQQLEGQFEASRIEIVAQTYRPSQEQLRQLLAVEESSEKKSLLDELLDWLQDSQWLNFPGWVWAAIFLTLLIIFIGVFLSLIRLYLRECRRSQTIQQHRYAVTLHH